MQMHITMGKEAVADRAILVDPSRCCCLVVPVISVATLATMLVSRN